MILREILKKIRQIEIRTNRVVIGFSARGQYRRTGVAPVSIFKNLIRRFVTYRDDDEFSRESGLFNFRDRRDACPTTRICTSRSLHSALV
jgi:hypothetical protein